MFCPNCGKDNKEIKTYCRQCGEVLPDLDSKSGGKQLTLTKRLELLTVHLGLSTFVSFGVGIFMLYLFKVGKINDTAAICSIVFFIIGLWQVIGISNTNQIKKIFEREVNVEFDADDSINKSLEAKDTNELLPEADFENLVHTSVTENTTRKLKEKVKRSTKS